MPAATGNGNARSRYEDLSEPPWYRWRQNDPAERCIRFIETYCRSPKGVGFGKPIKLAEFQKAWIREILKPGIWHAVLQAPRGQGKSTLLAGIAVWAVFDKSDTGQPQVPILATTVSQAMRSVYNVAVAMRNAEPELKKRSIIFSGKADPRIKVGYNDGECWPMSNDLEGLQGLDYTVAIVDEIGFQPPESWDAVTTASGKRTHSLAVAIGTPGNDRDKSALWKIRCDYLDEDVDTSRLHFTELSAPDDCDYRDEAMWRIANPAIAEGYLSIEALRADLTKPESTFRMLRLAQWVEGTDCWLGVDGRKVWRGLQSDHQLVRGADTWVGVDVGLKRDTTAVVIGQRTPSGKLHTTAKIWKPAKDQAIDVTAVMAHLRKLDKEYNLAEVAYDPRHFELAATILADEGLPMVEFPQSPERMLPACGDLYEAIMRGEISHNGAADYEGQILNAMPSYVGRGFYLTKTKSRGKIDAAIALALCHDRAQHPAPKRAPVFAH
ncbi:terminase TerL endonuclease subunit [Mycolicibacterium septicum]|uniref:Terminase TerL endonuclease subunit n=1 Tax=Mycolicibacterium septicum TaxID=98668 RepID=A0ABW9LUY9_9MYCO